MFLTGLLWEIQSFPGLVSKEFISGSLVHPFTMLSLVNKAESCLKSPVPSWILYN